MGFDNCFSLLKYVPLPERRCWVTGRQEKSSALARTVLLLTFSLDYRRASEHNSRTVAKYTQ